METSKMSHYIRRGFNQAILPKEVPKQGRWIKQSKNGLRRPFNIWFSEKLDEIGCDITSFTTKLLETFPDQPKTEEAAVRYWSKDVIPRARSQRKIATVIANELNQEFDHIMTELIQVIEDEVLPDYLFKKLQTKKNQKGIKKKEMNITNESNSISTQRKTVETIEVHKHSARNIPQSKTIGNLYIRAEQRMIFIDKELQIFYVENGNKYIINFEYILPLETHQLDFLKKIYPFSIVSQDYIQKFIDTTFKRYQHYSVQNKWLHYAAYSNEKIYVTTDARNIVQKHLMNPHLVTRDVYEKMNNDQKEQYKINAITNVSKRNENNLEYKKTFMFISF
jgi:hypothetical protein